MTPVAFIAIPSPGRGPEAQNLTQYQVLDYSSNWWFTSEMLLSRIFWVRFSASKRKVNPLVGAGGFCFAQAKTKPRFLSASKVLPASLR